MSLWNFFFPAPIAQWDDRRWLLFWNDSEPWTIGDSFEGVQVWGDTGSGKSSTSARVLAAAMLRAGYGGLVLTAKPDDTEEWRRNLEINGRTRDGIFFDPQSPWHFNFLDYELQHGARLQMGTRNAARILAELVAMVDRQAGSAGDPYWRQSAELMMNFTLDLLMAAGVTPSMMLAKEIILSAPVFADQVKDSEWQASSTCWQLLVKGRQHARDGHDFQQASNYWLREFPALPEKTRQSVISTFTASVARHFCSQAMHRMFGQQFAGPTSVSPEDIFDGDVVVVNLPKLEYGDAGRFAGVVWKYCLQLALQRRKNRERPVFIFSDESHYFVTDHDQLFQTTARGARCATVYLTQNRDNYLAESPGSAGHSRVASMCACLKTQILHQCSHEGTRRAFSDAIGKHEVLTTSNTRSYGKGKPTYSENEHWEDQHWVSPDRATELKTGGTENNYVVEAVVTKAGKSFRDGKPAKLVRYDQRNFERNFWGRSYTTVAIPKPKQAQ